MKKFLGVLVLFILISFPLTGKSKAEEITNPASIKLETQLYNVQFIVSGEVDDNFDVNLVAPDGTKYDHSNYEGKKAFYFKLSKSRSWLLNEAMPGEYKFEIVGSDQNYKTSIEKELRKPVTTMETPVGGNVVLEGGAAIQLAWTVEGDVEESDYLNVYLKPSNGWQRMPVGKARLKEQRASIRLPETVQDGEYELILVADNKTPERQTIVSNTKVTVRRGYALQGFQVTEVRALGDRVRIQMKVSNGLSWKGISTSFERSGTTDKPVLKQANRTELHLEKDTSDPNSSLYEWEVALTESGSYKGSYQVIYEDLIGSSVKLLPEFELKIRDWTKDTVKFLQTAEKTNLKQLQIGLNLQADSHVQVVDGSSVLYDQKIPAAGADGKDTTIQVPLKEGDIVLQVLVGDDFGNIKSYPKRYLADFTPPVLTMIQPQGQHAKLEGGFASGFVEKDSVVFVGEKEYQPDGNGYFRIDNVGDSLDLIARDSHGNETSFHWSSRESWNKPLFTFIAINVLLVGLTSGGIFIIRR